MKNKRGRNNTKKVNTQSFKKLVKSKKGIMLLVFLLLVVIGVVIYFVITHKVKSNVQPIPKKVKVYQAFKNKKELRNAVLTYSQGPQAKGFQQILDTYGKIEDWDVSAVKDFSYLFASQDTPWDKPNFSIDIKKTGYVPFQATIGDYVATSDTANLSKWETSQVTDMSWFACNTFNFQNSSITSWNTSNVTSMRGCFSNTIYKQNLSRWDTSQVEDMSFMFNYCSEFNDKNFSTWNVSQVKSMRSMFDSISLVNNHT